MKRLTLLLFICVALALILNHDADAKKKRKKGEPVICKKGKLIFEDDFSGKELLWQFDPRHSEWQIKKRILVTNAVGTGSLPGIVRKFPPVQDLIYELRILAPQNLAMGITTGSPRPYPRLDLDAGGTGMLEICTYTPETKVVKHAHAVFRYDKPRWIHVMFETLGSSSAATIDGKTITWDLDHELDEQAEALYILPNQHDPNLLCIDDVKVYEALPKDVGDEKGKKKR